MDVRRGDIVIVELDPTEGSEQRGTRPCLVVQNDVGNENAPTTIVVPFTTSRGDKLYPFEVLVTAAESPLREDSVALCSQIRTVSIEHRITESIGSVPDSRMEDVDSALEYSLGLTER
ncbi:MULTISPECIES: type II toxin-antitoxin system PemK/MazF family toxin [Natranaeroarchaeum]|uniref:Toxin-antitoxin addiction module toxin componentMazF (An endoRNAse) n=2 Tax=Natranaeroarchaeum TaxID=2917705 RepID=A0A897MMH0_9EURY|nr:MULTISPECIES: type II toxin-antitoxin system PemK/MazF family toxin [Natranaeroarchaeum]MCL9813402.1 type II toxin-antitoxin system PemK/MazF family toxin [Natranaeroarchaeum aerophilus]QSG01814.1 Toxin-antitoxin addiction module toxin componentMazF (an endoRNAse) [Natranaeroarchaeum sulfidigenes]